jgi:hypothetical protein
MSGGNGDGGWRMSSYTNGSTCVEAFSMEWRKSSHSGGNACVEVEGLPEGWVALRDNERPDEVIRVRPESWRAFLLGAKDGEFDLHD